MPGKSFTSRTIEGPERVEVVYGEASEELRIKSRRQYEEEVSGFEYYRLLFKCPAMLENESCEYRAIEKVGRSSSPPTTTLRVAHRPNKFGGIPANVLVG